MAVVVSWAWPSHFCTRLSGMPADTAATQKPWRNPLGEACGPSSVAFAGGEVFPRAVRGVILARSLSSDFFGIEEREGWFPDFESVAVWPATARLLWQLRNLDRPELAGQSSLEHFDHWLDPATRRVILCSRQEARQERYFRNKVTW